MPATTHTAETNEQSIVREDDGSRAVLRLSSSDELIKRLKSLIKDAPTLPWKREQRGFFRDRYVWIVGHFHDLLGKEQPVATVSLSRDRHEEDARGRSVHWQEPIKGAPETANLIIEGVNAIPTLLAIIEQQRREIRRLQAKTPSVAPRQPPSEA